MNVYWSKRSSPENFLTDDSKADEEIRRDHAIIAGKKRSIKEHLGRVKRSHSRETEHNNLDDLSIPPPGVPRTISGKLSSRMDPFWISMRKTLKYVFKLCPYKNIVNSIYWGHLKTGY